MNITTFKKGEEVIAYPSDSRERVIHLTVKSVTDKYVTCVSETGWIRKFNNDGKWFHDKNPWLANRLYHNMDEVRKESEDERLLFKFREDAVRKMFTPEEVRKFYEIHNAQNV